MFLFLKFIVLLCTLSIDAYGMQENSYEIVPSSLSRAQKKMERDADERNDDETLKNPMCVIKLFDGYKNASYHIPNDFRYFEILAKAACLGSEPALIEMERDLRNCGYIRAADQCAQKRCTLKLFEQVLELKRRQKFQEAQDLYNEATMMWKNLCF